MKRLNPTPWLILICIVLAVVTIIAFRSCRNKADQVSDIHEVSEIAKDTAKHWTDRSGHDHAQVKVAEADIESLHVFYKGELDSVTKLLRISRKQVQALTVAGIRTTGEISYTVDSSRHLKTLDDPYVSIEGVISDTGKLHYNFFDSVYFVTYYKKTGLFGWGRKEIYQDGFSMNPNAVITGLKGIRVPQPAPKRFSAGPYVGYGFDGREWRPSGGVSIQYSLIKF